jgi:tetratricopeptide (TPR) repeat protein/TolB-like protein
MSTYDDRIDSLGAAVFDGRSVDWQAELAQATDAEQARIVRNLMFIARVSNSHRQRIPGEEVHSPDPATFTASRHIASALQPGAILGGRYRIERSLGRGGMGEVWLAFDLKLRVEVALKSIHPAQCDAKRREALRSEVRAARTVISPHVCRIFDLVDVDGQEFVSMEYVDGTNLAEFLPQSAPLTVQAAAEIASQLLAGLQAIHDAGLVHRDLKPENIMRTHTGRVIVMDFGIARATADDTPAARAGTPAYMAPEQSRGQPADARTDVYAAGIVLAELLHGGSRPQREALWSGVHQDPPDLPESPWRHILLRAVAVRPDDRFPSARVLAREFDPKRWRHESGSASATTLEDPRPARTRRRHARRWIAWGIVVAGLAAIAAMWNSSKIASQRDGGRSILVTPPEVIGQAEGAEHAGRAFAAAIAVNLARAKSLHLLPVPAASDLGPTQATFARYLEEQRADLVLSGSLTRQDSTITATLTLVDVSANRVLWGVQEIVAPDELARAATSIAGKLSSHLGLSRPKQYEYFRYVSGSEEMAGWPDLPETIGALRRHDVPRGLELTERLVQAFPDAYDAHVMRVVALLDASWFEGYSHQREQALRDGFLALERVDPDAPILSIDGVFSKKLPERIDLLSKLLTRDDLAPGCRAHALRTRGRFYSSIGNTPSAIADLEEAVRLDPANAFNYVYFTDVLVGAGRLDDALVRARQAIALESVFKESAADVAARLGLWDEALRWWSEIVSERPNQDRFASYALALLGAGRRAEAIAVAEQATRQPDTAVGSYALARFWAQIGERGMALRLVQRSLDLGATSQLLGSSAELRAALGKEPAFDAILKQATTTPRL